MSSSFIFLAIMIVFLVIFSPGRAILSSHGSHWRKTRATLIEYLNQSKTWDFPYPVRHLVGVRHPVVIVEDHDGRHAARGHHEHDGCEVCPWNDGNVEKICQFPISHASDLQTLQR